MKVLAAFLTVLILAGAAIAGVAMPQPEGYERLWDATIIDCPNVTRIMYAKEDDSLHVVYIKDGVDKPFMVIRFADGKFQHYWYDPDRDGSADIEGGLDEFNSVFPEDDVCVIADEVQ